MTVAIREQEPTVAGPRGSWRAELPWLLLFLPLTIAFTWPLTPHLFDALAGDHGDSWQNLWNISWLARAAGRGDSPFFTHDVWAPDGVTLVFQTFDLPDALWGAPLLSVLPPWPVYNLIVLWVFASSGMAMYALGRGTGASRPAAFLSGCAYTFTTYHFGHALGHLHLLAMQWVPLYVLALWRVLEGGRWRWSLLGGVFLACASLSSWYYLVGAFLISLPVALGAVVRDRLRSWRRGLPRAVLLCVTYLALVGPLGLSMLRERAREPIAGSHPAARFSADLESFVFPNAAQATHVVSDRFRHWTGNGAENASYLGIILVLACVAGLLLRAPKTGGYLVGALLGIVLALGPRLHLGGAFLSGDVMPYVLAEKVFPLLSFMGVPVRFAFAATFGLAAALAPALDAIARRTSWRIAAPLALLALLEHLPNPFVVSMFPTPAPMRAWAADRSDFVVLDATRDLRHLWHQTVHQHPILGGYLTRTPARLERALEADPVAGPLWSWEPTTRTAPFRTDRLDENPFREPVVPGAEMTQFSLDLRGILSVPQAGAHRFHVESDDGAELLLDGRRIVDNRGEHPRQERSGEVWLEAGSHEIKVRYSQEGGGAILRAWVEGPGIARRLLGREDVPAGFEGTVRFRRREFAVAKDEALARLRRLKVRYVVQPAQDSAYPLEGQLGLTPIHDADGVRIYELPR